MDDKQERTPEVSEPNPADIFAGQEHGDAERPRGTHRLPHKTQDRKKSAKRFNAVDIVLIVLIVAVIGGAVFGLQFWDVLFSGSVSRTVEYTVVFENVSVVFADAISDGDTVYSAEGNQSLGVVSTDVENDPYTYVVYVAAQGEETAKPVLRSYPDRINLTVTVRVKADYTEGVGYSVNGVRIAVGDEYSVRFPEFTGTGTCIAVNDNLS